MGGPLVDCAVRSSRRIEVQGGVKEDNNIELLSSRARAKARGGEHFVISRRSFLVRPSPLPSRASSSFPSVFPTRMRVFSLSLSLSLFDSLSRSSTSAAAFGPARRGVPSKRGGTREKENTPSSSTLFRGAGTLLHARKVISAGASPPPRGSRVA